MLGAGGGEGLVSKKGRYFERAGAEHVLKALRASARDPLGVTTRARVHLVKVAVEHDHGHARAHERVQDDPLVHVEAWFAAKNARAGVVGGRERAVGECKDGGRRGTATRARTMEDS